MNLNQKQHGYRTLLITFLGFLIYHYNRRSVTLIIPQLITEGRYSTQDAGMIISAQGISIAILTFMIGVYSHRLSSRAALSCGLFLSGLSTLLFSYCTKLPHFIILWFINGIGQGFALPVVIKITKDNSPSTRFATNWSLMLIAVNIAGAVNPFLSTYITLEYNWRRTLQTSAVITLLVSLISYPLITDQSKTIAHTNKKRDTKTGSNETAMTLFRLPELWLCVIGILIAYLTRQSIPDWGQLYLTREKHLSVYLSSTYISCFEVGGVIGRLIAGTVSDFLMQNSLRSGSGGSSSDGIAERINPRLPVCAVLMSINAVALHLFCFAIDTRASLLIVIVDALLMGASSYGQVSAFTVISTEITSANLTGLSSSLVSLSSKIGAIICGYPLSVIANSYSWHFNFFIIEILCVLGVAIQIIIPYTLLRKKIKLE